MTNEINAKKRTVEGKKVKNLRIAGLVPAVLFDSKSNSESIEINAAELEQAMRGATITTIFDMTVDGNKVKAMIKEVQSDPVLDTIDHVSFFKIDENADMVFDIPIVLKGIAPAVKNNLGVLVQPVETVTVRCKLGALVPNFVLDISHLEHPGMTIQLNEIKMPEAIKLVHKEDIDLTVVTITELQKEEVAKVVEEAAASTLATPAAAGATTADSTAKTKK